MKYYQVELKIRILDLFQLGLILTGISVNEVRIIPDEEKTIVENVNFLSKNIIMFLLLEALGLRMTILQLNLFLKLLK